jgi:hypothetical protein
MNNNKNKLMKETSKNCVSDYPLSNTESERGVKRGILRNRNERVLRMCVPQSGSPSRAAGGKGATSSIVTADVDIPDKVLSGFIWQKCERRGRAFLLRAFWASRGGARARAARRREKAPPGSGSCWYCDRVVKVSFGRVECREFARTE